MKNGEYAVEEKKVATDREYTVWEILQGNLKVWWLMLFGALVGALLLGGYKYYSNRSFVSEKNYEDDYRVMASLMVEEYSGESAAERVGTVITVAESRSTYEKMKQLSVCGEAAADPDLAVVLAGLGVNSLSMTPVALDDVRASLAEVTFEEAKAKAAAALNGDFYKPAE